MSRLTERLAKAKAALEERERVLVIYSIGRWAGGPPELIGTIGGTPESQRRAIERWYAQHPESRPRKGAVSAVAGPESTRRRTRHSRTAGRA